MRRLMRWAARLYPAAWRTRYGDELDILLEEAGPRWADLLDIVRGALIMRMSSLGFWKIAAAFAIAGALVSGAWSLTVPDRYVSSAELRTEDADKFALVMRTALSREALAVLIRKDGLYLREPDAGRMDQAVDKMCNTAIRVQAVEIHGSTRSLVVSFTYPDRYKAQLVTPDLIALITGAVQVEVLDPPSDPQSPSSPNRPQIAAFGSFAGILPGLAASRFRRAPLAAALSITGVS